MVAAFFSWWSVGFFLCTSGWGFLCPVKLTFDWMSFWCSRHVLISLSSWKYIKESYWKTKKHFSHHVIDVLLDSAHAQPMVNYVYTPTLGRSEARQNILEKTRRGRFRRIWKILFVTVAMNQVKVVSVILFLVSYSYLFHRIQVLLCYAVQDIFEDYSSKRAKRSAA